MDRATAPNIKSRAHEKWSAGNWRRNRNMVTACKNARMVCTARDARVHGSTLLSAATALGARSAKSNAPSRTSGPPLMRDATP